MPSLVSWGAIEESFGDIVDALFAVAGAEQFEGCFPVEGGLIRVSCSSRRVVHALQLHYVLAPRALPISICLDTTIPRRVYVDREEDERRDATTGRA